MGEKSLTHLRQPLRHRCRMPAWSPLLPLDDVLQRRADFASTEVNIQKSEAQRKAARQYNPQVSMYVTGGWATASQYGYDEVYSHCGNERKYPPALRWGARFKTNRQQKALQVSKNYSKVSSRPDQPGTGKPH